MIKLVAILSLVLSLISPHAIGLHGDSASAGEAGAASAHAEGHEAGEPRQPGAQAVASQQCCDAAVGGCGSGMYAHETTIRGILFEGRDPGFATAAILPGGLGLAFEPPPPRV